MRLRLPTTFLILLLYSVSPKPIAAQAKPASNPPAGTIKPGKTVDTAGVEFFEKKVRPVLAQYCYGCHSHSAKQALGKLYLDSRQGMMQGGQHGGELVPGEPDKSRLLEAVRYANPNLQMPPGKKLPDTVLAELAEWVKRGAPWPEERAPGGVSLSGDAALAEKKKRLHWA